MLPINNIYTLYKEYNSRFFGSKLPNIKIEYSNSLGQSAGVYNRKEKAIYLSAPLLSGRIQDQKDTLAHEMIHVAQDALNIKERSHGPFFSACMASINQTAAGEVMVTVTHHIYAIKEFEESSMLGRIKKLLALSDSPNQNEAYAAAKKAQALIAAHGVKQADLATVEVGSELDEPLTDEVIEHSPRTVAWKFALLDAIASVNYCKCLTTTNIGLRVLGNKTHVEVCRSYYQYFCQLIQSEAAKHQGKGAVFLNRFREGMALEISDRLKTQFHQQNQEIPSMSSEICLASQYKSELRGFSQMLYPRVGAHSGGSRMANPSATKAGRQVGSQVGVGRHIVPGAKRIGASKI
jgi:SprT-like family/Protein of unknown function (DUF2786)